MDKNSLIKIISLKSGLKRNNCESVFEAVLKSISKDLKEIKNVSVENFGDFCLFRVESIIQTRKNIKVIYPPSNQVEFLLSGENLKTESVISSPKKKEIAFEIASEFKLTDTDSEAIVNIIFCTLKESFRKNKIVFIQKFGEFKNTSNNKIVFRPCKKLCKRINYCFNDLEIVEVRLEEKIIEEQNEFEYSISEEFMKNYKEICESGEADSESIIKSESFPGKKKLISDELIKLHNEIVEIVEIDKIN